MPWPGRYASKNVAVTGAAGGIGRVVAKRIAIEGGGLFLLDREIESLNDVAAEIKGAGGTVLQAEAIDIVDAEETARSIERFISAHGAIDCLVHCAGIVGESDARADESDLERFKQVIAVNLTGAFIVCQTVLPGMVNNGYGRILLLSSIAGKEGNPNMSGYVASKAGLIGLAKTLGKEYARDGITVNAIAPAVVATPMNEATDPATLETLCEKIPMGRMGTTEETASLILWICSEEASFNTGAVFDLSGGRATY